MTLLSTNNKLMGSISISKSGKTVYGKSIGSYKVTGKENLLSSSNTKYRIGSITKMYTASIIFQLMEARQLTLDSTLSAFFPEIPNANKITIEQLLHHRSGIPNFTDLPNYKRWMRKNTTEARMLKMLSKQKPDFEPNEKASYSNANYLLLGYIIEKITKKSYAEVVQERISKPLNLKNTYYSTVPNTAKMEASSFAIADEHWKEQLNTDMSTLGGAGGIISTPNDMCTFMDAVFNDILVKKVSLKTMMKLKDDYGMALFPIPFYEKKTWGHTGEIDGFNSVLIYIPQDSVALAFCSNGINYDINEILLGILSIYFNKPYVFPAFNAILIPKDELTKFEGVYLSPELPIKIRIKRHENHLTLKATHQSAFNLEAIAENKFIYTPEGIRIKFNKSENGDYIHFILNQSGREFIFTREIKTIIQKKKVLN